MLVAWIPVLLLVLLRGLSAPVEHARLVPPPRATGPVAFSALVRGDCVDVTSVAPALGEEVGREDITLLATCDVAHDAEIVVVGLMRTRADPDYPRAADIKAFAEETCPTAFRTYVEQVTIDRPLRWSFAYRQIEPGDGVQRVVCYVERMDGQPLTSSIRGQPPSATPRPSQSP